MKKKILIIISLILMIGLVTPMCTFIANYFSLAFAGKISIDVFNIGYVLKLMDETPKSLFIAIEMIAILIILLVTFVDKKSKIRYNESSIMLTEDISVPKPEVSKKQYGSNWWLDKKDTDKAFSFVKIEKKDSIIKKLRNGKSVAEKEYLKSGGILLGSSIGEKAEEKIYYNNDDTHSIVLGATRSGKTRSVVLQTIGIQALAGENMVMSDPKGELYCYTRKFLENLGYEVISIDFEEPEKSDSYNFLQNVIDYVNKDDIARAVDATEDIVKMLMGKQTGEPIWINGESSIIAFAILYVVIENKDNPQYQNLTNVYHFLAKTCTPQKVVQLKNGKVVEKQVILLNSLLEKLPDSHPAKMKAGVAMVAPSKTRGSFFTSAMTTLNLFSNALIYNMSKSSDFNAKETGKKRAIFIILPDQKETYYKLASLFITMHYNALIDSAKKIGNRLERRVNYNLDEFGNFSEIVGMKSKMTVAGGYGIRFNLFLQSFAQLDEIYGKEVATTLKDNAEVLIYLKSNDTDTQKAISEKLGTYTAINITESNSVGGFSSSTSYLERSLLKPDEVRRLDRPYNLVIKGKNNIIFVAPDISKYYFNKMFGLGGKEHNRKKIEDEQKRRKKINSKNIRMELIDIDLI